MAEQLTTEDTLISFDSRELAASLTLELIKQARQQICFFGPNIDSVLFDHVEVVERLSQFARSSHRTQIRFAVFDTRSNISHHHRLLPLAQRLTSSIHIHIVNKVHQHSPAMYLLVDDDAYLYCPNAARYTGKADSHDVVRVHELQNDFDEIWSHSQEDVHMRRLHI